MSRIPEVSLEDVTDAIRPALVAAMMGRDRPLSVHAQMAYAPAVLAAYMGVRGALNEHSTLEPRDRSAITLAVAGSDECDYGRAVTANVAHRAGWTDGEIAAIDQGDPVGDDPIDALLDVARQAARHTGRVNDATWENARGAGWTDQQLAEAFAAVGLALFTDCFVHYAQTELDIPAPVAVASRRS
jgi:alkylhydroperoxidase family enzyme